MFNALNKFPGAPDLHAPQLRRHLPEVRQVPFRERVPVPADQRGGGTEEAQRVPQVLRPVLPR